MNHTTKKRGHTEESQTDNRSVLEQSHAVISKYEVSAPRIVEYEGEFVGSGRSFLEVENNDTVEEFDGAQTEWILVQRRVRGSKREDRKQKNKDNTENRVGAGKRVRFPQGV